MLIKWCRYLPALNFKMLAIVLGQSNIITNNKFYSDKAHQ